MQTFVLKSYSELQDVYHSVAEDFNSVDYADWLGKELDLMADLHAKFFQSQTGPDGAPWKPNALSTIRRKGHRRILRGHPKNNHRLSRSLTNKSRSSSGDAIREGINERDGAAHLKFGSFVEYGPYHDVASGNRPARRHVGINEQHLTGMVERVADHVINQLAK